MTQHNHHQDLPPSTLKHRRRGWLIAVWVILILIFLLFVVALILALTLFKFKEPRTSLISATVDGVAPRVTLPSIRFELNLTLILEVLVENSNRASFRGGVGKSVVLYGGAPVGEADLSPGLIPARGSAAVTCRLTVEVDRLASNISSLIKDVLAGEVPVEVRTRVPGRVSLLGIFKKHVVALSDCRLVVGFPEMKIRRQDCEHETKF